MLSNGSEREKGQSREVTFGMREFRAKGTQFTINGRPLFLRGTLECAIFPKTGYPPTDTTSWMRIYRIARAHGLNHLRFHSGAHPRQPLQQQTMPVFICMSNVHPGLIQVIGSIGDGKPLDKYLYDESERMIKSLWQPSLFLHHAVWQ